MFGPDDPHFPATALSLDAAGCFRPNGVERRFWTSAAPIRAIFNKAFEAAGLPNYGPHSLRRTLMLLVYDRRLDPRAMKAWSQNLGHGSVLATFGSYATLSHQEQGEVMRAIGVQRETNISGEPEAEDLLRLALSRLDTRKQGGCR